MRKLMCCLVLAVCVSALVDSAAVWAEEGGEVEVVVTEPLDRVWEPSWVSVPVELAKGEFKPKFGVMKKGKVQHYLIVHERYDDGSVKRASALDEPDRRNIDTYRLPMACRPSTSGSESKTPRPT